MGVLNYVLEVFLWVLNLDILASDGVPHGLGLLASTLWFLGDMVLCVLEILLLLLLCGVAVLLLLAGSFLGDPRVLLILGFNGSVALALLLVELGDELVDVWDAVPAAVVLAAGRHRVFVVVHLATMDNA